MPGTLKTPNEELKDLKERVKRLGEEKERAERYLHIAEVILVAIDTQARITLINRKGCQILGYEREELIGENWFSIALPSEDHERVHGDYLKIIAGEIESFECYENYILTKKGERRCIAWHNAIIRDENGRIIGTLSSGEDITERKRAEGALRKSKEDLESRVSERTRELRNANERLQFELTERERAEEALRESERRLTQAQRIAHVGYWDRDLDAGGITLSEEAYRIFGLSPEERFPDLAHWHEKWLQLIHPGDRPRLAQAVADALGGGPTYDVEYRVVLPNGEERSVHSRGEVIRDESGRPCRMFGMMQDITDRKQAERELKRSNDLLRAIIETAPTAIVGLDLDGNVRTVWNPAAEKMLGWSAQEAMGRPLPSVPAKSQEEFKGFRDRIRSGRTLDGVEVKRQRRDGTPIDYSIYASPLRDAEGRITGNICVLVDITERKQAEEELRKKTEELDRFFTIALDLLCIANTDGYFLRLNPAWEQSLGYSCADLTEHKFLDFIHPDDVPATREAVATLAEQKKVINFVNRYRCKDGSYRWIEWRSTSVGTTIYAAARDITERKRAEEERLAHLRFFAYMDQVNRAIQGTSDLEQMMSDVLDVVLSILECDRAWLVYPCDPESASWRVPMERTRPEYPGAFALGIEFPVDADAARVFRTALASNGPVQFGPSSEHALPAEVARQFHAQSQIATAIYPRGDKPYLFGLHQCSYPRVWSPQEEKLLQEIGRRLGDGLTSLLANREVQESELRFREIFENVSDCLYLLEITADGRFRNVEVNPALERSVGLSRTQLIGKTQEQVLPGATARKVNAIYRRCVEQGTVIDEEAELDLPVGRRVFHGTLIPVTDDAGRIYRIVVIARDITEQKRLENIRQGRLRLLEVANSCSVDELLTATLDEIEALTGSTIGFYHFLEADQETLSLQNWSTNTLRTMCKASGKGSHYPISQAGVWVDCIHERRPVVHNDYASLPHRKGVPEGHAPVLREVVVPIFRGDLIKAIIGVGNKPGAYNESDVEIVSQLGDFSWDIAERKLAEEALKQYRAHLEDLVRDRTKELQESTLELEAANIRLREADRLKSVFLASMSHELRTPLNSIIGFTGIMIMGMAGELNPEQKKQLFMVKESANHLLSLINDVLDIAKIEAGRVTLSRDQFQLGEVVDSVLRTLSPMAAQKGVTIIRNIPSGVTIMSDKRRITQILMNLAGNAVKFTDHGTVTISAQVVGTENLELRFSDTGIGIRKEDMNKLFFPFQQVDSSLTKAHEGTGLGLYLSKKLASILGGDIEARSTYGQGSEFTLVLPIAYGRTHEKDSRG